MNETIFNKAVETDLSRENDGYTELLESIQCSFEKVVINNTPLFTTDVENLYDIFLNNLPAEARQHYTCHACKDFVNRYGSLVAIEEDGSITPVMWGGYIPEFFVDAVKAVINAVWKARVTGVFITSDKRLGNFKTGNWYHMCVDIPKSMRHRYTVYTAEQKMAEKKEEFKMLMTATCKYDTDTVKTAVNLLKTNSLYRSEKIVGQAEWFLKFREQKGRTDWGRLTNIAWKFVATAPSGFCHISGSVLGSLLDDIKFGYDFEEVKRRFDDRVNPIKYQRPQAAPTAQNVARAEKIVAELGIANSLKRRYARFDEVQKIWVPKQDINQPPYGVFAGIKTKDAVKKPEPLVGKTTTMTWEKFQRTVLPTAKKIEYKVAYGRNSYGALVTAEDPEAPPIIQWDSEENRNPFSWYLYSGGSYAHNWNIGGKDYVEVTGISHLPCMWQEGYEHHGKGLIFLLKNCTDDRTSSSCLFPEILRRELHEVRATIEAYSKDHSMGGGEEASACGLICMSGNDNWICNIRVTTDLGVSLYKLDRWD